MADKIPILRVFDDDGNEFPIPAIQGRKGDRGDGDMNAADYDPQGRKEDIFRYVDEAVTLAAENVIRGALHIERGAYFNGDGVHEDEGGGVLLSFTAHPDVVFIATSPTGLDIFGNEPGVLFPKIGLGYGVCYDDDGNRCFAAFPVTLRDGGKVSFEFESLIGGTDYYYIALVERGKEAQTE